MLAPAGATEADLRGAVLVVKAAVAALAHEGQGLIVSVIGWVIATDAILVAARCEQAFCIYLL